ncbi:MAG: transcription antiterminator, partial [Erysipelotrichaceae bacterium]|nr:transcription antiterminator [Erysipelotrichaceae bacterium]
MKNKTTFRIESLIAEFIKHEYLTAEQIAESLNVSIKTARSRMAELNLLISLHGAHIFSKPRFGYQLQIDDGEKWTEYMNSRSLLSEIGAGSHGERTTHIALSLLTADSYIKINDFADELYVSPQIVSESLKELETIFSFYKLKLERKPYYGLKLIGREFDKRNCIISCYINDFRSFLTTDSEEDNTMDGKIIETVLDGLTTSRIQLTEVSLQSTVAYAYLSYLRYKSGFIIPDEDIVNESALKGRAATAAKFIFEQMFEEINPGEVYFFSVYISAMRYNDTPENRRNIVITPRIDTLVTRIFETVRNVFGVDFSNNLRMRMMLAQHLLSLDLRVRYHIPLLNDVYLDIRKNYPYAYSIANEAISVLVREYGTNISSSENDWLALIFATGLYDIKTEHKLNVLVVCQLGVASSQLLKHDIQ